MITTSYVWTELGEEAGRVAGYTRLVNTPASVANRPMEKSPEITRAWLDAGYIKKVSKPQPFLFFRTRKAEKDKQYDMITFFQDNDIPWEYYDFLTGEIRAGIIDEDELVHVSIQNIKGDLHMITEKDSPLDILFEAAKENKIKEESYL